MTFRFSHPNRYVDEGFLVIRAHVVTQGEAERDRLDKARKDTAAHQAGWRPRALPIDRQRLEFRVGPRAADAAN